MLEILEQTKLVDLLHPDLRGQIEVREITEDERRSRFFTSLDGFKAYSFPADKNIYMSVYSRVKFKGDKEHSRYTNAVWADYDNMTLAEAKGNIERAEIPYPSIFVSSGNGIHAYWLLTKKTPENVENILKAIARKTNADMQAAEKARVMRVPGTWNVKSGAPKLCEIVEQNDNRYDLEAFKSILNNVEAKKVQVIEELETSKMGCIRLIAKGVGKGQRNFALGKITAFMKQQGYSRKKAFEIANRWNKNNNPVKPDNELKDQFNRFWDSDYKYLGCKFSNPDLERINRQLCPLGQCEFHACQQVQVIDGETAVAVDNELFKQTVFPKITALEIACYSWITREKELTREQLSKYVNRHVKNQNFIEAIKGLKAKGMIEINKGIKRRGIPETIILKSKSNYGRGYTLVPNLLTKLYTKKGISDNAYKLMVLLKHYSFGKAEVYPTIETLAAKLGITEEWVSKLLKWLHEDEGLIERKYKQLDNGKTKIFIKLLY